MSASIPAAEGGGRAPARTPATHQSEQPAWDRAALPVKRRMTLMWAVMLVSICQFLDATIANVAIPHMKTSLGASDDSVSWVLTSFIMAGAIFTPVTGWLSDRVGSRNLFLGSTAVFLLSSACCGAATSLTAMVVFRTIQGAASALMGPLSQTVMFDINPPSKQAGAVSLWGTVSMVAPISGPFIGGFLTESLNWRWVYYVNLPLGIPAILIMWALLPSRPLIRRELDRFGFGMIALGLGALHLLLDRGQQQDWFASWEIVIETVIAASCLWMFVVRNFSTDRPLFNRQLYANPNFLAGIAFMTALGVANIALSATLPTLYQTIYGYSVVTTGLLMAPRGVGLALTMMLVNKLVGRVDFRVLICFGFCVLSYALWSMSQWALEMGREPIVISGFIQGMGLGFIFTPINLIAFGTLSTELRTDGSSLLGLFRSLGGSFGISYIVTTLARTTQASHAELASHVTANMLTGPLDLGTIAGVAGDTGTMALELANAEVTRQAAMLAYIDNFHVLSVLMLALAPMPFLLRKSAAPAFMRAAK